MKNKKSDNKIASFWKIFDPFSQALTFPQTPYHSKTDFLGLFIYSTTTICLEWLRMHPFACKVLDLCMALRLLAIPDFAQLAGLSDSVVRNVKKTGQVKKIRITKNLTLLVLVENH